MVYLPALPARRRSGVRWPWRILTRLAWWAVTPSNLRVLRWLQTQQIAPNTAIAVHLDRGVGFPVVVPSSRLRGTQSVQLDAKKIPTKNSIPIPVLSLIGDSSGIFVTVTDRSGRHHTARRYSAPGGTHSNKKGIGA